jgi:hypothetical protein
MESKPEMTKFTCINCPNPIPLSRFLKKSCTCSTTCFAVVRKEQARLLHQNRCRMCHRPCTPQQMKDWQSWAKERGIVLKRGRPSTKRVLEAEATKTLAEGAAAVQSESTTQKRSRLQSRKEVRQ